MTLMARQSPAGMLTAVTWETLLTAHYLRSDGPFGASPIRSIDATPRELARAASEFQISDEKAAIYFLKAFSPSHDVPEVLRGFKKPFAPAGTPGYFRYLVLSAYVPAIAVDEEMTRNFRSRLGQVLGLSGAVENISELPALWRRLVRWCEARRAEGKPYRRLILPDPGSWTLVGYSNRLAFPSWRDSERLARRIEEIGLSKVNTTKGSIAVLKHEIEFGGYSPPMREAFEDFRIRYQRGERLLVQHRFWRLLEDVRANLDKSQSRKERSLHARLILTVGIDASDLDLELILGAELASQSSVAPVGRIGGPIAVVFGQILQTLGGVKEQTSEISRAAVSGLMLFVPQTWGMWQFAGAAAVRTEALALIRSDHTDRASRLGIAYRSVCDGWSMTGMLAPAAVEALVGAILRVPTSDRDDELADIAVVGGIRTGKAFLGRSATLPQVQVTASADLRLITALEARGSLAAEPDPRVKGQNGLWRLVADAPVGGSWRLLAQEGQTNDADEAELLLRFDERAVEHTELADPDGSAGQFEPETEMLAAKTELLRVRALQGEAAGTIPPRLDDLLEAIYAEGRSGWTEADLIPLVRRILPFEEAPSAFDVIHLLQASGWLEPRLLTQWRGRRWFLRPPKLVVVQRGDRATLVLDGSTPEVVRERFREVVERLGGGIDVRPACGGWGIPMLVAQVNNPSDVVSILGFDVEEATGLTVFRAPGCWPRETRSLTNRVLATSWCWHSGSFKTNAATTRTAVKLERHTRVRGDDRDVYSVTDGSAEAVVFTSRTIAILEAHRMAGKGLFRMEDNYLVRCARDGCLPASVVRWLRFLHLANPGVLGRSPQLRTIAYPADSSSATVLSKWFGLAIDVAASKPTDRRLSVGISRHRTARPRLVWRDGFRDERYDSVENA